jgi:hypothetical protein
MGMVGCGIIFRKGLVMNRGCILARILKWKHVKCLILRKRFQVESYSQLVLASGKPIGSLRAMRQSQSEAEER